MTDVKQAAEKSAGAAPYEIYFLISKIIPLILAHHDKKQPIAISIIFTGEVR